MQFEFVSRNVKEFIERYLLNKLNTRNGIKLIVMFGKYKVHIIKFGLEYIEDIQYGTDS